MPYNLSDSFPNQIIARYSEINIQHSWQGLHRFIQLEFTLFICSSNLSDIWPRSEPALELHSRVASSVGIMYHSSGPNTGSNFVGWRTQKNTICYIIIMMYSVIISLFFLIRWWRWLFLKNRYCKTNSLQYQIHFIWQSHWELLSWPSDIFLVENMPRRGSSIKTKRRH